MSLPAVKLSHPPTLADIDALPPGVKGEIIEGVLYAMTRPRGLHQEIGGQIQIDLGTRFRRGHGGPGGWWILPEPGIELPNSAEVSPDIAGWRRERLPTLPKDAAIKVVPDWVCEVLSPTTYRYDLMIKRSFYARVGVAFLWIVDPERRIATASVLENGRWVDAGTFGDETEARIPPFDASPINVSAWWTGDDVGPGPAPSEQSGSSP